MSSSSFDELSSEAKRRAMELLNEDGFMYKESKSRLAESKEKSALLLAQQAADKETWLGQHSHTSERLRAMGAQQPALAEMFKAAHEPVKHDDLLHAHAPEVAELKARCGDLSEIIAAERERAHALRTEAAALDKSIRQHQDQRNECRDKLGANSSLVHDARIKCRQAAVESMRRAQPDLTTDVPPPVFWLTSMRIFDADYICCRSDSVCGCCAVFSSAHGTIEVEEHGGGMGRSERTVYIPNRIFVEACAIHRHASDHSPSQLFTEHLARLGISCQRPQYFAGLKEAPC